MILENISSPADIKALSAEQLKQLADETRRFLVKHVTRSGGHLASNLGVVELTIALHYCYNAPEDKIVWDVGHQSYVHKIFTGRREGFFTLRAKGGISGFPRAEESVYDAFNTGHASTAISAAFGMAAARDLRGKTNIIAAVVGDGSLTGGLAWEALNNAGRSGKDITVILNDNEMSISASVGAISRHLNDIRVAPKYTATKRGVQSFLRRVPIIGGGAESFLESAKNKIRYLLLPGVLFEEIGFNYIGPVDGHDVCQLISVLTNMREMRGPLMLHVITKKGKGYPKAEKSPQAYHGISAGGGAKAEGMTFSEIFGKAIVEAACENPRVAAVTASMTSGTGLTRFSQMFPERFFDVGIAEAHAVTFAAGLAKEGFVPVVAVYSTFLQRAYDQIIHDVCIQNLPVVFAVDRAGLVGPDGETHQGVFDLSYLCHVPNLTVIAPKNGRELAAALRFAVSLKAPVAIRYPRGEDTNCFNGFSSHFVHGMSETLIDAGNIAVLAVGTMAAPAGEAVDRLWADGIEAGLYNPRFLSPVDTRLLDKLKDRERIFVIEENVARGGFGETVAAYVSGAGGKAAVKILALPAAFVPHGARDVLLKDLGLDAEGIYRFIRANIAESPADGN
jgi:1-deoxy-D-xylulose-5-phosphate synthase